MSELDNIGIASRMQQAVVYLPLSPTYKNRLVALCEKPSNRNKLMEQFIKPNLLVEPLDQHIAMHQGKRDAFGTIGSRNAADLLRDSDDSQIKFSHFSNLLRTPAYGTEFKRNDQRWRDKNEAPSQRGTIGAFWAFTFEWDSDDLNDLQVQFDWAWKKGPNGKPPLEELDEELRKKYKDYRGIVVVWSGNKSIHIYLIFDPSHMSKHAITALAERGGTSAEAKIRNHWSGDIRPDAIWEYYKATWWKLNDLITAVTGIEIEFDDNLQTLFQKRRLPWGVREIADDSDFGIPTGLLVPQAVLMENLIANAPKQAQGYLLRSSDANELQKRTVPIRGHCGSGGVLDDDGILEPLSGYLKHHWGSEYPKPSHFQDVGGEIFLYFYNDEHDITPATCIGEGYSQILYRGKGARTDEATRCLPGNQTLGDLVSMICDGLDLKDDAERDAEVIKPGRPTRHIAQRVFENQAMQGGIQNIYRGLRSSTAMVSVTAKRAIIKSVEGSGKSTSAVRQALDFQLEDHIEGYHRGCGLVAPSNGHTIVATKSYDQCEEQYQAYVEWCQENRLPVNAVLLKSLSQYYRECCDKLSMPQEDRISAVQALCMGYSSRVDAIEDQQPEIYAAITKLKNAAWKSQVARGGKIVEVCGFNRRLETLIFTTHSQAQQFNKPSKSRAWQHPDFDIEMDSEAWISLATQFRAYRIIHDEVSISDLLHIATEHEVDLARRFRDDVAKQTGKPWSETRGDERHSVYTSSQTKGWITLKFFDLLDIIDAGFGEEDQIAVDFDYAPYGRDNHDGGIYRSTTGDVIYVKAKDWWFNTKARILITTTEEFVTGVASQLTDSDQKHAFKIEDWSSPRVFSADPVELAPDTRACAKSVQELADNLLYDERDPVDKVITDIASGEDVITHLSAQGKNDLDTAKLATILTFMGPEQYAVVNAVAQKYSITNPFDLYYRDRINQAVGRNQGLRRRAPSHASHRIYVAPTFMNAMGGFKFFAQGRYPAFLAA